MLTPEERCQRRAAVQKRYQNSDKGRKTAKNYEKTHGAALRRLAYRLKARRIQSARAKARDRLRELKLRLLQPRILAAIQAGCCTYSERDGLIFPALNGPPITDPAGIDLFLKDLGF